MSDVPKYWKEYNQDIKDGLKNHELTVKEYRKRKEDEYNSLPWYKKLFASGPDNFLFEFDIFDYEYATSPKRSEPTIVDYYNWVVEKGYK